MRSDSKKKALDAIKRLRGLTSKMETMIEQDAYCVDILGLALAMQGHVRHIQGHVLESHLHTCAAKKLSSASDKGEFIDELVKVIGLSKR